MKRAILIGLMAALSAGAWAEDKAMNLRKTAEGIRAGSVAVGKEYSLGEDGRFHKIHTEILGIKCGGCHSNDAYPNSHLYLRKSEFPYMLNGEKVKAVERAKCIGCHSEGNVATVFYNKK